MNINKKHFAALIIIAFTSIILLINNYVSNKRYSVDMELSAVQNLHYLRNNLIDKKYVATYLVVKFASVSTNRKNLENAYKEFMSKHSVKCNNSEIYFDFNYDFKAFYSVSDISSNPGRNINYKFSNKCKDFLEKFPEFYIDYINNIMLNDIRDTENNIADVAFIRNKENTRRAYKDRIELLQGQINLKIALLEVISELGLNNSKKIDGDNISNYSQKTSLFNELSVEIPFVDSYIDRELRILPILNKAQSLESLDPELKSLKEEMNRIIRDTVDIQDQNILSILIKTDPRLNMININTFILALIGLIITLLFIFRKKIKLL